jgi:hypothetical protein
MFTLISALATVRDDHRLGTAAAISCRSRSIAEAALRAFGD